jgi:hypothetical protein
MPVGRGANDMGALMSQMGGGMDMGRMQQQLMQNPELMQQMMQSPMMESMMNNPVNTYLLHYNYCYCLYCDFYFYEHYY